MFNSEQPSYQHLRSIVRERTSRVVAWVGSGLSAPAGLPTWSELKERLCLALENKAETYEDEERELYKKRVKQIRDIQDYWLAFQMLREWLRVSTYRTTVRRILGSASEATIPDGYRIILDIPITGILNLNLDRLATRAYTEKNPGKEILEFNGKEVGVNFHVLKGSAPFIVNLHGVISNESSWVFTRNDLKALLDLPAYRTFITTCLTSRTILFLGITADDFAVGGHLERLSQLGIDSGPHFWITHRSDDLTDRWAEENGVQVIRYRAPDAEHSVFVDILGDLRTFQPADSIPPPVRMTCSSSAVSLRSLEELREEKSTEKLRDELNAYAASLLSEPSQSSYERFATFCNEYDQVIYRAWYINTRPPDNVVLGYTIEEEIAEGAYGRVFKARRRDGSPVAVKILKEDLRRKKEMLQSFRRGVRSMRILAEKQVEGMVPYEEASEIPAFCAMELIEGPNLTAAVQNQFVSDWPTVLDIAVQLAQIIRRAHLLPERVLHRDIRPPNVMLKNYYSNPGEIKVVVLDFDLSWHMGADELSMVQNSTIGGYLAPEQVMRIQGVSTRNAAVDSFGLGMTLYFLRSGRDPMYLQHRHKDWEQDLMQLSNSHACAAWVSLPRRYARLILNATKDEQAERWDMAQIEGELERLSRALLRPDEIQSIELLTEELTQRVLDQLGYPQYAWDDDRLTTRVDMPSGVRMTIGPGGSSSDIKARIEWSNEGDRDYKNVRKYLKPAIDGMISKMLKVGWKLVPESNLRADAATFALVADSGLVRKRMNECAEAIAKGIESFRF